MVSQTFYCFRCNTHKRLDLKSTQTSPSGKPICISCQDNGTKGKTLTKSLRKLPITHQRYLSDMIINKQL